MAAFPKLKTGAIAQYPVTRREQFQNQTVRFVDGTEQRYRDSAGSRLEWEIQLSRWTRANWRRSRNSFWRTRERSAVSHSPIHGTDRYTTTAAWRRTVWR